MPDKKVTLKEIAKIANVSIATVSYVMNGRNIVSEKTRTKVLSIAKQLNYTPDLMAQSLRTQDSKLVFALVNALSSVFNSSLLAEVETEFERYGYQLLTLQGELPAVLRTNIFDGGIVLNYSMPVEQLQKLESLVQKKVVLLSSAPQLQSTSVVCMDNDQGMSLAMHEMRRSKHQRICFIQGTVTSANNAERYQASKQLFTQLYHQDDFEIRVYDGHFMTEDAYQIARQLLQNNLYDAFVCFNDSMALGVYQAAAELGLTVGKDISVIGFDNSFFAKHLTPTLTTIDIDKPTWAHEIVRSYFSVDKPDHDPHIVIPATLVKRGSIAY